VEGRRRAVALAFVGLALAGCGGLGAIGSAPLEPVVEITAEPVVEITPERAADVTAEPVAEMTAEPVVEITAEPVVEITAEPEVEITAEPSVEITAEPTVAITVAPIEFGTDIDTAAWQVVRPTSTFKASTTTIAWITTLRPVPSTPITVTIAAVGSETTVFTWEWPTNTYYKVGNVGDYAGAVDRAPGSYVLRVLRDGEVVAEGQFTLK